MSEEPSAPMRMIHRCCNALEIALLVDDAVTAVVAATRLRAAIMGARVTAAADAHEVDGVLDRTENLLNRAPPRVQTPSDINRLIQNLNAATDGRGRVYGPDLVDLDGARRDLPRTVWSELHIVSANLSESNLYGATLDDTRVMSSVFTRASLVHASLKWAHVTACDFAGALLTDAVLDGAVFEDCDFRGAHFGTEKRRYDAPILCTHFVRCDLRETSWDRRFIGGAKLRDCKVYGMHGAVTVDGIEITGADGSPAADGSGPLSGQEVIWSWRS